MARRHWATNDTLTASDLEGAFLSVEAAVTNPATTTTIGVVELSTAPANPAIPVAVGDNDPRLLNARLSLSAGETIPGHKVVSASGGGAFKASSTNAGNIQGAVGISLNAAATGETVNIATSGRVDEPSWSWPVGKPIFLGTDGALVVTPPTTGYLLRVGISLAPTALLVQLTAPIFLG